MTDPTIAAPPADPLADLKARAADAVEGARDEILDLSHRIHANPEPAFEEHLAAGWVAEVDRPPRLRRRAPGRQPRDRGPRPPHRWPRRRRAADRDPRRVRRAARASATAAATTRWRRRAWARRSPSPRVRDAWAGEIVFLGTPGGGAGERQGDHDPRGLFEGLDAALLYHPCDRNHVEIAPLASEDVHITFKGFGAHAASDPWNARNALDAMIALFVSVGLWRQQLPTHCRVHGIIQEGGTAANIVPDRTRAWFMLRSADQAYYEVMKRRFIAMCEAAASASDVEVEVEFSGGATTMNHNRALARPLDRQRGGGGHRRPGHGPGVGLTDMANVSWVVPAIHPELSIVDQPTPGHTIEFRDAAARPRADRTTLLAATLVAQTAIDLLAGPGARRGGVGRVQGVRAAATDRVRCPGAPRWTADPNRRRAD